MQRMRSILKRAVGLTAFVVAIAFLASLSNRARADEPNPYAMADNTWISISGSVDVVHPNSFVLDYGDGMVTVEMDDGDRDADAYKLMPGDKVTVTGTIDDDFFETTSIEAGSVYVENIGTTFYASPLNDESYTGVDPVMVPPIHVSRTVVRGTVSQVNDHEFVLDTGPRILRVDVGDMGFDPLDDEGYLKIDVGDRVKVIGQIDTGLFMNRELDADTVVELHDSPS
jgi:uncharacterized protein YdeI (BOF family)